LPSENIDDENVDEDDDDRGEPITTGTGKFEITQPLNTAHTQQLYQVSNITVRNDDDEENNPIPSSSLKKQRPYTFNT